MRESLHFCHQVFIGSRAMTFSFQEFMAPLFETVDLKPLEGCVLAEIGQNEGMSIGELGVATCIRATNLTPIVHSLEEKGLVTRKRDVDDARSWRIHPSSEGRKLLDRLDALIAQRISKKGSDASELIAKVHDGFKAFEELMKDSGVEMGGVR